MGKEAAFLFLVILVVVVSITGGIITGIMDMKRGNRKSRGNGLWGLLLPLAILELFNTKKKK